MSYTLLDQFIEASVLFIAPSGLRLNISTTQFDILGSECNSPYIAEVLASQFFDYVVLHADSFCISEIHPDLFKPNHRLVLILGDSHHGHEPLTTICSWVNSSNVQRILNYSCPHHDEIIALITGVECIYFPAIFGIKYWHQPSRDPSLEIIHIGNISNQHQRRRSLLEYLSKVEININILTAYGSKMNRLLNNSLVSFNCSLNCDISHRISESLASGTLVLTDKLTKYQKFIDFLESESIIYCYNYNDKRQILDIMSEINEMNKSDSGKLHLMNLKAVAQLKFRKFLAKSNLNLLAANYLCLKDVEIPDIIKPYESNFNTNLTLDELNFYQSAQEMHRTVSFTSQSELYKYFKGNLTSNQILLLSRLSSYNFSVEHT